MKFFVYVRAVGTAAVCEYLNKHEAKSKFTACEALAVIL